MLVWTLDFAVISETSWFSDSNQQKMFMKHNKKQKKECFLFKFCLVSIMRTLIWTPWKSQIGRKLKKNGNIISYHRTIHSLGWPELPKWIVCLTTFIISWACPWMLPDWAKQHLLTPSNDYYYDDNFIPSTQINEFEISGQYDNCNTFCWYYSLFMLSMLCQATWHNDTGNFPCKKTVFVIKVRGFKMKYAIKIFMPVQTWYWRRSASVHLTPWCSEVPKPSRCFVSASLALSQKRTHKWIIKQLPRDRCKKVTANRVKDGCGRRAKGTTEI